MWISNTQADFICDHLEIGFIKIALDLFLLNEKGIFFGTGSKRSYQKNRRSSLGRKIEQIFRPRDLGRKIEKPAEIFRSSFPAYRIQPNTVRNSQFPKWAEFKGDLGPSKTDNFKKYTGDWGCGPVLMTERLGFYLVIRHLITWFWINYLIIFGATAILVLGIEASPWSMNKGSLNFHIFKKPKANSGPSGSSFLRSKGGTSP